MARFNIIQSLYENGHNRTASDAMQNHKPYEIVLKSIQDVISNNHSAELADVIENPESADKVRELISRYIFRDKILCMEYPDVKVLVDKLYEDMAGFSFLEKYLRDPNVEEINGNSWEDIEVITRTGWHKIPERFADAGQSIDIVKKMCRFGGVIIDGSNPTRDSYISKGVRISATIPPCVDDDVGATFSIRKQSTHEFTQEQLVKWGTATDEIFEFLKLCIKHGVSIAIAGSTGSGKTTDINFLLSGINDKRIYTIEDSREFNFVKRDEQNRIINRVVHTKTRISENKKLNVTADELLKRALRFDPEIIVPAEMRGEEAMTAQESGRTGHTILTTLHASTAQDAYTRILSMCMMSGTQLSEGMMLRNIIEALPIMVFKKQMADKTRKYLRIIEATDCDDGKIVYRTLFEFMVKRIERDEHNRVKKVHGEHRKRGNISHRLSNILLENAADIDEVAKFSSANWLKEIEKD